MRRAGNAELKRRKKQMLKFEKADKQEVTKCSKAEKDVKPDTGTEDRGSSDEIYSG